VGGWGRRGTEAHSSLRHIQQPSYVNYLAPGSIQGIRMVVRAHTPWIFLFCERSCSELLERGIKDIK